MTRPINRVLIIGGGFSGMSAAIEFRKRGVQVDLVEIDTNWRSYGAGISLGGATLRAFRQLGILEDFLMVGHAADGIDLFDAAGDRIGALPTPRIAGDDVPGGAAIMRPALAAILAKATRKSGAEVRLGCTFTAMNEDAEGIEVKFTDGEARTYDLVVGADGLNSQVRKTLFPSVAEPAYTGQGVWRAVMQRPANINNAIMWIGPHLKAGVNPVSPDSMYLFLLEDRPTNDRIDPSDFLSLMRNLLSRFPAPELKDIAGQLDDSSHIIYRPLEGLLVEHPWFKGRVVLIGDTVHATTPHLASGACIGVEDALVLAEECERADDIETALSSFQERRWERCRMVVQNSKQLGDIEISGGDKQEHAAIMRESLLALANPI